MIGRSCGHNLRLICVDSRAKSSRCTEVSTFLPCAVGGRLQTATCRLAYCSISHSKKKAQVDWCVRYITFAQYRSVGN